jgi:hypothetical protein
MFLSVINFINSTKCETRLILALFNMTFFSFMLFVSDTISSDKVFEGFLTFIFFCLIDFSSFSISFGSKSSISSEEYPSEERYSLNLLVYLPPHIAFLS